MKQYKTRILLVMTIATLAFQVALAAPCNGEARNISGVYPDLCTYGQYSLPDGGFNTGGAAGECGIGAVVPWAGKLWMINYAPHRPQGSEHKLYSVDEDMNLTVHSKRGFRGKLTLKFSWRWCL